MEDEHQLLRDTAERFLNKHFSKARRPSVTASDTGFDPELWRQIADMGWMATRFPEAYGGLDGSLQEVAILIEQFGHVRCLSPFQSTVIGSGSIILAAATNAQRNTLIPMIINGTGIVCCAFDDKPGVVNLTRVKHRVIGGYELSGTKRLVPYPDSCEHFIVSASLSDRGKNHHDTILLLIPGNTPGVVVKSYRTYDAGVVGEVQFDGVRLPSDARMNAIAAGDATQELLQLQADQMAAMLVIEASGLMWATHNITLQYLKTRKQFGHPLGSFQALAHRAVDMYIQCQLAQSLAWDAVEAISTAIDPIQRARRVSAAKSFVGVTGRALGQEAVQLHGGMGMTDDYPVGHYLKRLTAIDLLEHNADWHRARYRSLSLPPSDP